jgi:prevent-host-death family protein
MDRINANDFRANLKEWMEAAREEPVKITRKTGEAFVLLNADEFEKIQLELASLRGIALGLSDVINGNVQESTAESTRSAIDKARARVLGKQNKKAVG